MKEGTNCDGTLPNTRDVESPPVTPIRTGRGGGLQTSRCRHSRRTCHLNHMQRGRRAVVCSRSERGQVKQLPENPRWHLSCLVASHLSDLHTSWIIPTLPAYFFYFFFFLFLVELVLARLLLCHPPFASSARHTWGPRSSPNRASAVFLAAPLRCRPPARRAALTPPVCRPRWPTRAPLSLIHI